jgi:hypothetical protein
MKFSIRMSAVIIMTYFVSACGGGNSDSSNNSGSSMVNVAKTVSQGPTVPAISMTNNGRAIAVWSSWSSSSSALWINHYNLDSGWGIAQLGGSGIGIESGAKVAVNSSGSGVLTWIRQINSSKEILAAVYHPADGWSAPTVLDSTQIGALDITVLMDENGTATVFWQRLTAGTNMNTTVMTSRHTANGWDAPQVLISGTSTMDLAGNSSGQIMAIWQQSNPDPNDQFSHNYNSFVRMIIPGSGWSTAQYIGNNVSEMNGSMYYNPTTTPGHYTPRISLDNLGNALALWSEAYFQGDSYHITVNTFTAGIGWGIPLVIGSISNNSTLAVSPFVSDSSATSYVSLVDCQYSYSSTVSNIFVVTYKAGIGWAINKVIDSLPFYCLSPRISVGKNGNLYLTWLQIDGNNTHLWSKQYSPGSGWGGSRRFDDWYGNIATYETAWDSSGNIIVIWSQNSGDSWVTLAKPLD